MACEGRGKGFGRSSETVDSVALGRGVMEIQKGAPSATRNQKRNIHDEQLRKPSPGPCGVIRTPREDKEGGPYIPTNHIRGHRKVSLKT